MEKKIRGGASVGRDGCGICTGTRLFLFLNNSAHGPRAFESNYREEDNTMHAKRTCDLMIDLSRRDKAH